MSAVVRAFLAADLDGNREFFFKRPEFVDAVWLQDGVICGTPYSGSLKVTPGECRELLLTPKDEGDRRRLVATRNRLAEALGLPDAGNRTLEEVVNAACQAIGAEAFSMPKCVDDLLELVDVASIKARAKIAAVRAYYAPPKTQQWRPVGPYDPLTEWDSNSIVRLRNGGTQRITWRNDTTRPVRLAGFEPWFTVRGWNAQGYWVKRKKPTPQDIIAVLRKSTRRTSLAEGEWRAEMFGPNRGETVHRKVTVHLVERIYVASWIAGGHAHSAVIDAKRLTFEGGRLLSRLGV